MDSSGIKVKLQRFLSMVTVLAGGALLAPGAGYAHDAHQHGAAPASKAGDYVRSVRSYSIPDMTLIDRSAQPVRLREMLAADEPVMINFIFTSCTAICPVMSSIFANVPPLLGADAGKLRMISISIDPENDTPQQLAAYAGKFGAGPRWTFLTGSVENIAGVQRAFDTYRSDKMSHEPLTLLRPAPGRPWVRIDGFASPQDLAREYRRVVSNGLD